MAILFGVLAASCLISCGFSPARVPALRVNWIDFRDRVSTVCLNALADGLTGDDKNEALLTKLMAIDTMIAKELQRIGYATIEPEWVRLAWERAAKSDGGCIDVHTGRVDSARCDVIRDRWRRDLRDDLGCGAVLTPEVALVRAPWKSGMAEWDGVKEMIGPASDAYGYVTALSLSIALHDADGQEIYFSTGGIQTLATLHVGFWTSEFENIPPDQLLSSPGRNLAAVEAALADLPRQPTETTP